MTEDGQILVPPEIRVKLGLVPGSEIEWIEDGDRVIIRKVEKYTCEDIHRMLFPEGPAEPRSLEELKQGIEEAIREKHERR
jgi:AbrB family looped-hinge helix DNA binding protein